jgi:hypothetical protein
MAEEAMVMSVVETVEILMAWKNVTQCSAIRIPPRTNLKMAAGSTFKGIPFIIKYRKRLKEARNTRYNTKGIASIWIKAPSMAVKPHIKTIKWRCN